MQESVQGVTFLRHAHLQEYLSNIRRLICDFTNDSQDYVNMIKRTAAAPVCNLHSWATSVEEMHCFCPQPLSTHDSRHRLLSNEHVPVACELCGAYE